MTSSTAPAITMDGMSNVLARMESNLGISELNERRGHGWLTGNRFYLDMLYRLNWLAGRVVDCVADDMARDGIDISLPGDPHAVEAFQQAEKETALWPSITEGIRWGRLYGGAIAVMLVDGQDPATPLNFKTVAQGQFKGFMVFDRWEVDPSTELVTTFGRDYGLPEFYTIRETSLPIHYTRAIRFVGAPLPLRHRKMERHWGASVLEKVADEVAQVKDGSAGAAKLLSLAYLRVFGIEDFRQALAEGGDAEKIIVNQFTAMVRTQNISGASFIDAKDKFQTNAYTFAGIRDVQLGQFEQVSGASGIPLVRLIGQSIGGLGANGETMERSYYDQVMRDMERDLRPALDQAIPLVLQSKLGGVPKDWSFSFRPLNQMRATEKATVVNQEVNTLVSLYHARLFDQERAIREVMEIGKRHERFAHLDDKAMKAIMNDAPSSDDLLKMYQQRNTSNGDGKTG